MHLFPNALHSMQHIALAAASKAVPLILDASQEGTEYCDWCIEGEDHNGYGGGSSCADLDDDSLTCHEGPRWTAQSCTNGLLKEGEYFDDGVSPVSAPPHALPLFKLPPCMSGDSASLGRLCTNIDFMAFAGDCASRCAFHGGSHKELVHAVQYVRWVRFEVMRLQRGGMGSSDSSESSDRSSSNGNDKPSDTDSCSPPSEAMKKRRRKRARAERDARAVHGARDLGDRWVCIRLAPRMLPFRFKAW
jgi:hypothetical protein